MVGNRNPDCRRGEVRGLSRTSQALVPRFHMASPKAETLHGYFPESAESPRAKRAKSEPLDNQWPDPTQFANPAAGSDDESVPTLRSIATSAKDWVLHQVNALKSAVCEPLHGFDVAKLRRQRKRRREAYEALGIAPGKRPRFFTEDFGSSGEEDEFESIVQAALFGRTAAAASAAAPSAGAASSSRAPAVRVPASYTPAAVEEHEADTTQVVARYESPLVCMGLPHPSHLCKSATLDYAPCEPIDPDSAEPYLAPCVLKREKLSSAQLHAVALAMRAFERGHAFVVGDGTGVGKGRTSMGVIMSHWHQSGARRALIVSVGSLASDVMRDFNDTRVHKCFPGTVFIDASKALPDRKQLAPQAVIFTTYSQVLAKGYEPYVKLIRARNGRAAGTLVLDEVHKGMSKKTNKTYVQVEKLLEACSDSPLLCMSATFASQLDGVRMLAPRLGLVGQGSAHVFQDFDQLKTALNKHNETGLELLTAQLSCNGTFLARCISYHGTRAEHLACTMSDEFKTLYDKCAGLYRDLNDTGLYVGKEARGYFVCSQLRFFKSLTLLAKLPHVVARVRAELAQGRQVVVSVLGTSEAALMRADPDEVEQSGGVSQLRGEILATIQYGLDNLAGSQDKVAELEDIAERAKQLELGRCGAIDQFKHELEEFGVAELTGRSNELIYDEHRDGWFPQRLSNDIVAARARFQSGECRVALVSAVASTGISLHDAGDASGVSRPRTMILFELPWSASASLQLLGRVHRSAQLSEPLFLTTAITTAENRFSAAVAKRLKVLGALISGDQRDDGGSNIALDGEVLLSAAGNRAAAWVAMKHRLDASAEPNGRKVLNAVLAMPPSRSEPIIAELFDRTAEEHQSDIAKDRIPPPRQHLKEDGEKTKLIETFKRPGVELRKWQLDRRRTWAEICDKKLELEANGMCTTGFARSIAQGYAGLALCHYRDGFTMVRCHFLDGRVASIHPDKLITCNQGIQSQWTNSYDSTGYLFVTLAMVPCLEALACLTKPPKTYRVEFADGTRSIGVSIEAGVARKLRKPKAPPPPPPAPGAPAP